MFLKARHWPVGAFAFHIITAKRTLQIGTSSPACAATFVLSSPLVRQDGLTRTVTECVWTCPFISTYMYYQYTFSCGSLSFYSSCEDILLDEVSAEVGM